MRRDGYRFPVEAEVFLTVAEVEILMKCSAGHYDGVCQQAGKPGGFIYGFHNQAMYFPGDKAEISVKLSWRELDLLAKVLEIGQYFPVDEEQAVTALWKEVVMLLGHLGKMPRAIDNLLTSTARMTKDRELNDNGRICDMTNDDAVDTLHGLISKAREILGVPDRPNGDEIADADEVESRNAGKYSDYHL